MPQPTPAQAAWNNSQWCDTLCSTHDHPGEFHPAYWMKRGKVPPYVPQLVTLDGRESVAIQLAAIRSLVAAEPSASLAIKDSFQCLDLAPLGFSVLFNATWIAWTPETAPPVDTRKQVEWSMVTTPEQLADWELAWRGSAANADLAEHERVFPRRLLDTHDLHFLIGTQNGAAVASGALNRTGDVVGLSNVFSAHPDVGPLFPGCVREARRLYPHLPIVGYARGDALLAAKRADCTEMSDLTVWHRQL